MGARSWKSSACKPIVERRSLRCVGWIARTLAAGAAIVALTSAEAQIRAFERLVMPGPLASAHAEYEAECGSCHVRFERQSQRQLCLDCHDEIADDFATATGFHSRSPEVAGKECASCHTDHEGRAHDIVGLDERAFDHGLTDFELLGKHAELACADCHAPQATFHAAETECLGCHRDDDRHHGNLGESCADCHSETSWADARFDHEIKTGYALTGAHAMVETCAGCHVEERYEGTPDSCVGCHREDDEHMGLNGPKCEGCHATTNWQDTRFDHFKSTGFALSGGHSGLMCESCHEGNKYEVKPATECYGCHSADDKHEGRNGTKCADCHKATEWPDVTFDHARDTEFPLNGAHRDLECAACHVQPVATAVPDKECFSCHAEDDPHAGQLGKSCGSCHAEVLWDQDVRFDHDFARFPLLGQHRDVVCEDCHQTPKFHDAPEDCFECHAEDDVHESRFGNDCTLCHNPNDWQAWAFDHTAQTDFALGGGHAGLDCNACHRKAVASIAAIDLATSCGGCHRKDDVHRGEFGQQCERCHTTESFKQLRVLQ